MEYLQYPKEGSILSYEDLVLNLIINGIPSILGYTVYKCIKNSKF